MSESQAAGDERRIRKVTLAGFFLNLLLALAKLVIGLCARSHACVADAIHSLSDCITDVAVIVGVRFWSAGADARHPNGHRRIEALVTLFIGAALSVVAVLLAVKAIESISGAAEPVTPGWPVFFAALLSILVKEGLYQWTAAEGARCHSSALVANAWHHRSDALSSIPVAAAVIAVKIWPKLTFIDPCAAVLVAAMLLKVSWDIMWPELRELADEGADGTIVNRITTLASSIPGILEVHKVRTRRVGDSYTVDMHILVDGKMSVEDGHRIGDEAVELIRQRIPAVVDVLAHLEPFSHESLEDGILNLAKSVPGVKDVHRIRVRRVLAGYDADLHILVEPEMSVREGHEICETVRRQIVASKLGVVEVLTHLEPFENTKTEED